MNKLSQIILPAFHDFWSAVKNLPYTFYVAKGGRNSSKSTTISIICVLLLVMFPINGLVMRRVEKTLSESVYEQIKEATFLLGISDNFRFLKSPLKVIYKPRGNYIIFRGADEPQKIKSIKTSEFPLAFLWIEELDEFKTEDDVQVIVDSILRAELPNGLKYKIFYSYNPPKRKQNWVNKKFETQFLPPNVYVHHSSYLTNPYLTKQVLEEIEHTKETKPLKYKWMYLGEAIGGGIVPFDNLRFEKIPNDLFNSFNNIRQGLDWGYAVDPMAFGRWHYDKTRRILWAMDEIYGVKLSNRFVADEIKRRGYHIDKIIADSAEPKSIAELKSYGINRISGAKKGPGSVEYGEKWLDDLEGIVIDYDRTPNTAREFENIDYQVDKDGNPKSKLEDRDNHTIDDARYACEDDMKSNTSINWLK